MERIPSFGPKTVLRYSELVSWVQYTLSAHRQRTSKRGSYKICVFHVNGPIRSGLVHSHHVDNQEYDQRLLDTDSIERRTHRACTKAIIRSFSDLSGEYYKEVHLRQNVHVRCEPDEEQLIQSIIFSLTRRDRIDATDEKV